MLSTSASVVAGVRKQAAPQVKQLKQTVPIPRAKWVKRYVDMPKADSGKQKQAGVDDDRVYAATTTISISGAASCVAKSTNYLVKCEFLTRNPTQFSCSRTELFVGLTGYAELVI